MSGNGTCVATVNPSFRSSYARQASYALSSRPGPIAECTLKAASRMSLLNAFSSFAYFAPVAVKFILHSTADFAAGVHQQVQLFQRFALRGLNHDRAVHHQRERHCIRMEPIVDHALGNVPGLHSLLLLKVVAEDHFMH